MAVTLAPARGARRRPVDAAINLVPFIDLLSCCIAFLLITAVWSEVASIDVSQAGAPADPTVATAAPPVLFVGASDYQLRLPGAQTIDVEPAALSSTLRAHRGDGEELVVQSTDGARYERLVRGLDAARAAGYRHIAVGDGS
jgi:biopolymer transport protein ExbD